jgi:HD-GYP domain-containing protein (c-di-GMP phosphodiesterase class II)
MALLALGARQRRTERNQRRSPDPDPPELTPDALLALLDRHAPGVCRHMERTAALCRPVGERLGLSERVTEVAVRTAEVHDVGKLVLPRELLSKRQPLDDSDRKLIRQTPVAAQQLLECVPETRGLAGLVRAIHERYDGFGYPDALRGKAIPLPARIVAVCDAYDAMREGRPYRPAMSIQRAVKELWRGSGAQFDPKVTGALCEVVQAEM